MSRPGVQFSEIASAPRRFAPTATDVGFMVAVTEQGPSDTYVFCQSLDEWNEKREKWRRNESERRSKLNAKLFIWKVCA